MSENTMYLVPRIDFIALKNQKIKLFVKLYQNGQLPLGELSSDSFEKFVYQSLVLLGEQKKFRMQSGRQPSGDEGFDCVAKTENSDLVCIQCKRYNNTLYTGTVVEENPVCQRLQPVVHVDRNGPCHRQGSAVGRLHAR